MSITVAMRTQVSQLYVSLFGRAPDGEGLGYWVGQLAGGKTVAQVAQDMFNVTAARAYYPSFMTNDEIVAAFYVNVLGRTADAEGQAYWVGKMNATGATKGSVIADMINAVTNYTGTDAAGVKSKALFANKVEVAQYYGEKNGTVAGATAALVGVTEVAATVTAAKTAVDAGANPGQTFMLTAGVDNIIGTAGNDTITADNTGAAGTKQLTVADTINGGAGTDTLRVFLAAADTATGQPTTLTSIENIYINGGAITAYTAPTGTTGLSIDTPVVLTNATYTLSGQAVTLKSALTASNAATMTTTLASAAAATALTVNLDGYTSSGTDTHTLALTGAALATATLNTTAASRITSLTNADAALTKLNLTGTAALTLTDALTALRTYDASGTTGAVTLTLNKTPSATLSYTGGSGRDIVAFNGGAATQPKSTMTLDGGAGATDKLVIKDTDTSAFAGINKAINFEQLGLGSGTANSTYDMSVVTSITTVAIDTATGAAPAAAAAAAAAAGNAVGVTGTTGTTGTAGILMTGLSNANTFIVEAALTSTGGVGGAGSAGNGNNAATGGVGGVGGAGAIALTLTPAVDTGSNATTLTLSGVTLTSAGGAGGAGAGINANGGAGGAGAVTVSATSYESITIVSNANATGSVTANVFNAAGGAGGALAGTGATGAPGATAAGLAMGTNATVTITGAASFNPGLISGTNLTVNASALTGALTMSSDTGNDVITGGSGVNTITLTGGVDTVNLAASTARADSIVFTSATGTTSTNFVKIAGFTNAVTTGDKLDTAIGTVAIQADVAAGTATGVANLTAQVSSGILSFAGSAAATATLANKVTAATAAAFAGAQNEVVAFEHNGNTYVFASVDGNANAFNAGADQLIELTGVVGLTALSATASGATTLFIA